MTSEVPLFETQGKAILRANCANAELESGTEIDSTGQPGLNFPKSFLLWERIEILKAYMNNFSDYQVNNQHCAYNCTKFC